MTQELRDNTRRTGVRLIIILVIFTLLGTTLAVMIRKEQSLRSLRTSHRTITVNLPRMAEDIRLLREQVSNFRLLTSAQGSGRSVELLLFSRLDQIKSSLPVTQMTVAALDRKDGKASVSFSLKLPLQSYATVLNGIGRLQTETFPFVVINKAGLDASATGQFSIDGSVIMPLTAEGNR